MHPEAPALLPLFHFCGWTARGGGDGNREGVSQSPGHQVEATLIEDVWVRQEYDCDRFGARHPPLHTGIQGSSALDQCAVTPVGRWQWD